MQEYEAILSVLKTGDLLFFSGNTPFSNLIKLATRSKWSHIGMVFGSVKDGLFCWEANKVEKGAENMDCGVTLRPLREKILNYDGDFAIRRLENINLGQEQKTIINAFLEEVKCFPYEKNMLELFKSAYDGPFGLNVDDLSSIFCSELIAAAYQRLGLLAPYPEGLPANEYTPADFARPSLRLLSGNLSELTLIPKQVSEEILNENGLVQDAVAVG